MKKNGTVIVPFPFILKIQFWVYKAVVEKAFLFMWAKGLFRIEGEMEIAFIYIRMSISNIFPS